MMAALSVTACGAILTRPYAPVSEPPEAASEPAFREAFTGCVKQVTGVEGVYYDGRATKSGVGAATALGTASAVSSVAMATAGSTYASVFGALGTVIIVLPAAGAYGIYRGVKVSERDQVAALAEGSIGGSHFAKQFLATRYRRLGIGVRAIGTRPRLEVPMAIFDRDWKAREFVHGACNAVSPFTRSGNGGETVVNLDTALKRR